MKRILSTLVLLTMVLAATAEEDKFNVNGVNLLKISGGCSNVSLGSGNGTYSYNPETKELILNNAKITRTGDDNNGIYCNIGDITIRFKGECEINTEASGIYLKPTPNSKNHFYNEGTVTINSTGYRGIFIEYKHESPYVPKLELHGGKWTIKGSQQGIEGFHSEWLYMRDDDPSHPFYMYVKGDGKGAIYDLSKLKLFGLGIGYPRGGVFNETNHSVCNEGTSTIAKEVIITTLAFRLGGREWTTYNVAIVGPNISGTVTFDADQKIVKLHDATITGRFQPYLDGMTLISTGTNTLNADDDEDTDGGKSFSMNIVKDNLTIRGSGTLNTGLIGIRSDNKILTTTISGGVTVNVKNTKDGIPGFYNISGQRLAYLVIDNSTLNVNVKSDAACIPVNIAAKLIDCVVSNPAIIVRAEYGTNSGTFSAIDLKGYSSFCNIDRKTEHMGSLSIVPGTAYDLWVNGVQVNNKNYSNLNGALTGGGSCSYNPNTKTLSLNNAKISYNDAGSFIWPAIFNEINDLVINNSGTSEIGGNYIGIRSDADFAIKGNGHLKVYGTGQYYGAIQLRSCDLTIDNTELTATGGGNAIFASSIDYTQQKGSVRLNNSYLHLKGNTKAVDVVSFDSNCEITKPVGGKIYYRTIVDANRKAAQEVEIVPKKGIVTAINTATPVEEAGETSIYTTSGTLVWQGAGQPQLPRGIYIMKKNGKVQKVQKN
jgi:hypothetical protein